jgi:hypothetical protein
MRFLLKITFFLLSINALSQTVHLSGVVIDKETLTPVPKVSIFTRDNKTGTLSTAKGYFSLTIPISQIDNYLYFTNIGYESDSILISKITCPLSVQLIPKTYLLKEVYVMPDSTLLTLLRKAYNRISENYPDRPTRYEGFFQKSTSQNDSLVELIEIVLSVYKESYLNRKEMPGQIEILRSRMKQLQSSQVGFVGGAFVPVNSDVVLKRESYISPEKMNYFKYDFLGIKNYSGKDCYEITFSPLNKDSVNIQGSMLIDIETLAYVFFEINIEKKENAKTYIGIIKPTETIVRVFYEKSNGKWYLKQISSRNKYESRRWDSPLYSSLDFITTYIQTDSVQPIPVEKRLEYFDPIEAKVEAYNPKGWTDSDILANENQVNFQFSTDEALSIYNRIIPKKKISLTEAIIKILPKLKIGYGVSYNFDEQLILYQSIIGYKFNKRWSVQWQATEDLFVKNVKYKENGFGIEFRKNINNAGYPLFLGTSLSISDERYSGKYNLREQSIVPQLSISKRISRFFTFELFVNYSTVIHSNISSNRNVNHYPQMGINMYLF